MAATTRLSMSLIIEAVLAEQLRYEIDPDGDLHIEIGRQRGKDLNIYLFNSSARSGILKITCLVNRWFSNDDFGKLLIRCNQWNRDRRIPRAYVSEPDKDGDYYARLDHVTFCEDGITRELIRENLRIFIAGSDTFWDELEREF